MIERQELDAEMDTNGRPIHRYQLHENSSEPLLYLSTNHREYSTEGSTDCGIDSFVNQVYHTAEEQYTQSFENIYAQGAISVDDKEHNDKIYSARVTGEFEELLEEHENHKFNFLSVRLGLHKLSWTDHERGKRLTVSSASTDTSPLNIYRQANILPMVVNARSKSVEELVVDRQSIIDEIVNEVNNIVSEDDYGGI